MEILDSAVSRIQQRQIARTLVDRGIQSGDRVILRTDGAPTYVSAVLAMLQLGVIAVPLDPRLTDAEIKPIIDDVDPALVIDQLDQLEGLLGSGQTELDGTLKSRPMHFTSGTTGRSKGVWSGFWNAQESEAYLAEEKELWGFERSDRHLVVSPIYHSAPLRFAMGTILAGGSVAILPKFDPVTLASAVHRYQPTSMFCVPTHLQRFFAWLDNGNSCDLSSFRLVAHAGAACSEPVRRRAHELFGLEVVWEFYGSTEGQFTACSATEWHRHPGTVGKARPGRLMSVDDDGQLWCTVPSWGKFSYWNDNEKTAASWRDTSAGPAFTVGDLGRIEDDYVYLDARRTDLIISGGVNVYPAEVERALEQVPGVHDVSVFGVPDPDWGQRVCAAWVGTADIAELRQTAQEKLSRAKRPKEFHLVPELPRTATGKVRRRELQQRFGNQLPADGQQIP